MKKYGLLLLTILLCAAAGAIMTGAILAQNSGTGQAAPQAGSTDTIAEDALTVPSGKGGTVEACFLSAQEYEKMKADRSETDFDPSCLFFEGLPVPYDKESNTVYIPQSCETSAWEGMLRAAVSEQEICILNDEPDDKRKCIEEGRSLSLAVVTERKYMECSLVFTGLPAVCISNDEGEVRYGEDYSGPILVLDPYREEYQDCACSFHIRGATSLLFDKKSYRVELKNAEGENAKESFLGMRRDDDWILNSLCTDRSLAREKICYELWEKLNGMEEEPVPSSRIEYCELFLNNEYLGVFGLQYPVDKKLMKLVPGDLLYKVGTWYEESDYSGNLTDHNGSNEILNSNGVSYLELKFPKEAGPDCIYDPFELFQDMVFETGDMTAMEDAGISLDLDNFILHELFCEMTRAGDNTWKNMFIAARKKQDGGYVLSETIWDLNYTFGDRFVWDPDHGNTEFYAGSTDLYKVRYDRDYGYVRLAQIVDGLRDDTGSKWREWRAQGIGPDYINGLFEENSEYLRKSGAFARNAQKWSCPAQEEAYSGIKEWVEGRFEFLDDLYNHSEKEKAE